MTISPAANGFIKGLLIVVIGSVVAYFADPITTSALFGPAIGGLVAAAASALESYIKEKTGRGTFGAVEVR